ncbi:conserved hypothetical protein [Burkholderiales bacterium 8X]|nr:conserved hypothetical protein [Burkholderiales bacterium 8X]
MAQSVLGSISLGFRPLWNRARGLAGLRLYVHEDDQGVDGAHLLRTLGELWTADSPTLVLSVRSRALLLGLASNADSSSPQIEVPVKWLGDAGLVATLSQARQRGVHLIAAGTPQDELRPEHARLFDRRSLALAATDAATAMQAALQLRQAAAAGRVGGRSENSPIKTHALVDGVASRALAEHALDQQGAWAVCGWPMEDVLHRYAGQPAPVSRRALVQVMSALDREDSLERIDQLLGQEPTLTYRMLLYLNSAGLGLRSGVSTVRHGLMMLGYRKVNAWLAEQLPTASEDANLRPINATMVIRGHLMAQLMDAGVEDDLRREVYLCGLFSQLDLVMDEPLRAGFNRIPLADRIVSAAISQSGPYAAALQLAMALESADPAQLRALRIETETTAEDANRALLKTLAALGD